MLISHKPAIKELVKLTTKVSNLHFQKCKGMTKEDTLNLERGEKEGDLTFTDLLMRKDSTKVRENTGHTEVHRRVRD